nr:Clp protease proteolytic subunit [Sciadopitys verticillata]AMO00709.1 Clp protease proteolytic subunit [Sciadopitys verticillata]
MGVGIPKVPFQEPEEEDMSWVDVYTRLFRGKWLFLTQPLDRATSGQLEAMFVFLKHEGRKGDFAFFLSCSGGSILSGLALRDLMITSGKDVITIGMGLNASIGAFLLSVGSEKKRMISSSGRLMIHQPYTYPYDARGGQCIEDALLLMEARYKVVRIYADRTNSTVPNIWEEMERERYLRGYESLTLGFIDWVDLMDMMNILKSANAGEDFKPRPKKKELVEIEA